MIDIEQMKEQHLRDGTWSYRMFLKITLLRLNIELYFYNCKIDTIIWKFFGFAYICVGFLTLAFGSLLELDEICKC